MIIDNWSGWEGALFRDIAIDIANGQFEFWERSALNKDDTVIYYNKILLLDLKKIIDLTG